MVGPPTGPAPRRASAGRSPHPHAPCGPGPGRSPRRRPLPPQRRPADPPTRRPAVRVPQGAPGCPGQAPGYSLAGRGRHRSPRTRKPLPGLRVPPLARAETRPHRAAVKLPGTSVAAAGATAAWASSATPRAAARFRHRPAGCCVPAYASKNRKRTLAGLRRGNSPAPIGHLRSTVAPPLPNSSASGDHPVACVFSCSGS